MLLGYQYQQKKTCFLLTCSHSAKTQLSSPYPVCFTINIRKMSMMLNTICNAHKYASVKLLCVVALALKCHRTLELHILKYIERLQ